MTNWGLENFLRKRWSHLRQHQKHTISNLTLATFTVFFFLYVIVFFPLDLSCPITSTSYRTINMTNILPVHHILQYSSTFFCTRQHLLGDHWLSVKLKRGRTDVCQERKHIKKMIKLIYRRQILCYNHKFDPQIWPSGIMLGLK